MFEIIVACTANGGIGKNGIIPWNAPLDLKNFYNLTTFKPENKINVLIMGRRTYESIGNKPLKKRLNIVVSKTLTSQNDVIIANDFNSALNICNDIIDIYKIFIIGGVELYKEALINDNCSKIHLTYIKNNFDCDVFFPLELLSNYKKTSIESNIIDNELIYDKILYENK
jgi:dihydrofolate reductase